MADPIRLEDLVPVQEDTPGQDLVPVEPNVSERATLRLADIRAGKDQTGQTFGPEIIPYGISQAHATVRGTSAMEATGRLLEATREFLKAPGPWLAETLSRPSEDTPLTAALGASLEIASASVVPLEEPFVQAVRMVGEELGLPEDQIREHEQRAAMAAGTLGGMVASIPHLAPKGLVEAHAEIMRKGGYNPVALLEQAARERGKVTTGAIDKVLKRENVPVKMEDLVPVTEEVTPPSEALANAEIRPPEEPPSTRLQPPTKPVELPKPTPQEKVQLAYDYADAAPEKGPIITSDAIADIERQAIQEESSLQAAERLTRDELVARELGVDPVTGEPVMTAEEKRAQVARKNALSERGRRDFTEEKIIEPSRQAFKETYGGTPIGSAAAKQARQVARAAQLEKMRPAAADPELYGSLRNRVTGEYDVPLSDGRIATIYRDADSRNWYLTPKSQREFGIADGPTGQEGLLSVGTKKEAFKTLAERFDTGPKTAEENVPRGTLPVEQPQPVEPVGVGEALPIRKIGVGDVLFAGDPVLDSKGNQWTVMQVQPDDTVLVARTLEEQDGRIVKADYQKFPKSELSTTPAAYDPEKGLPAVKLSDGTVVVGSRYTHNSAVREAKSAGLGELLVDHPDNVGHVIGEDKRWVTLGEYAKIQAAKEAAGLKSDGPATTGFLGAVKQAVVDILEDSAANQGGFIEMPGQTSTSEKLFNRLRRRSKSPVGAHGLKVTQHAAPEALDKINTFVAARGGSRFWISHKFTIPIEKAIGPGGADRFIEAVSESQIQGRKQMWSDFAEAAASMGDDALMESADTYMNDWYREAIDHVAESQKEAGAAKGRLTRALAEGNVPEVRKLLRTVFQGASDSIGPMSQSAEAFLKSEDFPKATQAASEFLQQLADWNRDVGGHETRYLGPADVYLPLSSAEQGGMKPFSGITGLPFRKLRPGTTMRRTGLSKQYDYSVDAIAKRVGASIKASGKNQALDALVESGVGKELKEGERLPEFLQAVSGVEEKVKVVNITPDRTIIQEGKKPVTIPGRRLALPESIAKELEPVFTPGMIEDTEAIERIHSAIVDAFLRGVAEPAVHGQNVVSFLGHATAESFPQAVWRTLRTDLESPEAIAQLQDFAEHGRIPNRYASVTFSKELARQYGAQLIQPWRLKKGQIFNLSPILYGPHGLDIRVRVAAGLFFDEHPVFKGATAIEKTQFLDQLGHYQAATRTAFQKAVTRTALQPFFTAAGTRVRNALEVWGLSENQTPLGGWDLAKWRLRQQVTQGVVGGTMAWIAAHKMATGEWPWNDKKAKLWQIPVPKSWEKSQVAKMLWHEDSKKQKYIGLGGLFPVGYTMLRLSGGKELVDTALRGGSAAQNVEAAAAGALNATTSLLVGPVLHVLFSVVPELEPPVIHFGKTGQGPLIFVEKGEKSKPGLDLIPRAKAGLSEIFQLSDQLFELVTARSEEEKKKAPKAAKFLVNLLLKQAVGSEEDIHKTRERLRRERVNAAKP